MQSTSRACSTWASTKWPMRTLAMTGMEETSWISRIFSRLAMRATPPSRRMSEGTRSRAITAAAPASSAMRACSALVTSMITPPRSCSQKPILVCTSSGVKPGTSRCFSWLLMANPAV